jgi:hypothetical protein
MRIPNYFLKAELDLDLKIISDPDPDLTPDPKIM